MNLEQLRAALRDALDRRATSEADMKKITDAVEARDDKNLTEEESKRFNELRDALKDLDTEIANRQKDVADAEALDEGAKRAAELRQKYPVLDRPSDGGGIVDVRDDETKRLVDYIRGESRGTNDGGKWGVTFLPDRRSMERRDLLTSGGAGTNTIPTTIYDEFIIGVREFSPFLELADRIDTMGGEPIDFPTATKLTSVAQTEGQTITEADPTYNKVTLTVSKRGRLIQVSPELVSDSVVNMRSYLVSELSLAIGADVSALASAAAVNGATASTRASAPHTADDVIDMYYELPQAYRNRGTWVAPSTVMAEIRKFSGDNGPNLWTGPLSAGEPPTLLGRPVRTDDTIVGDVLLFGDVQRAMKVRFAGGVRIEQSEHFAFGSDLITYRGLTRFGAAVVLGEALLKTTWAS